MRAGRRRCCRTASSCGCGIPILNKGAIWTYWRGAYRDTGRDEGATMVLQTDNKNGWFWYIPQHDDTVSVGIVSPFDYLFKGRGTNHEKTYLEEVDHCPAVKERIAGATRMTGYFVTRDYSYRSTRVAGDGWVLVGDAFGFLDPLYSSGVLLALKSGELAADAIVDGLERGDVSEAQLGRWGADFNQGVDRMRRLVCEFYDGFSFGQFVRKYPHLRGTITDLLIGDLFNTRVDAVWGPMESLYKPGKAPIPPWNAGTPGALVEGKSPAPRAARGTAPLMAGGFQYTRRVQFSETDLAGIAHFSAFFRFMEEAEHALWRAAGLSIGKAEETGGWPRVSAAFDFKNPLRFEDEFDVAVQLTTVTRRSIQYRLHDHLRRHAHRDRHDDGRLHAERGRAAARRRYPGRRPHAAARGVGEDVRSG